MKHRKKHEKMDKLLKKIVKNEMKKPAHESALIAEQRKVIEKINELDIGREKPMQSVQKAVPIKLAEKKPVEEKTEVKQEVKKNEQAKSTPKLKRKMSKNMTSLRLFTYFVIGVFIFTIIYYYFNRKATNSFIIFGGAILLFSVYLFMRKRLQRYNEIKKMEEVFPDFISLMSSNLRAGMTIDRALILSARKEFAPLDKEILKVGKDILTAREISEALYDMGERIGSEEIKKTIQLLISGIRSGGNISVLLEETSNNMRERGFVKKRAASNVLMYVIFIFFAVAIGAPMLFSLSTVLVQIMSTIFADVPVTQTNVNLPFTINSINVSLSFVIYFSASFIVASAILASLILGLVSKGDEKDGLKYTIPLILIGLIVFFASRMVFVRYFAGLFG